MLFKVRQKNGDEFLSGSWIYSDGTKKSLRSIDFDLEEMEYSIIKGKQIPTKWKISFLGIDPIMINANALNTNSGLAGCSHANVGS